MKKYSIQYLGPFILTLGLVLLVSFNAIGKGSPLSDIPRYTRAIDTSHDGYKRLFNDIQSVQLPAARSRGIRPLRYQSEIAEVVAAKRLVRVYNTKYLSVIARYPYLTPEACAVLEALGRRFQERSGSSSTLRVSDCLRTRAYVDELKKDNINVTLHSCHLYGTTFDISYAKMRAYEKEALARCLMEMRSAGYIYVKYEVKQPCFHITVRRGL